MAAVVAGAVAIVCLYRQVDEEIRRQAEQRLAQHYSGLKVTIRSAQLVEGKGIRIRDLSIVEPNAAATGVELLHVEEAMFECPTDWKNLAQGNIDVHRATLRRPTLRATRQPDGTWSSAKLLPVPSFSAQPPEAVVEGGVVEIMDPQKKAASPLVIRDVNMTLTPGTAEELAATPGFRRLSGELSGEGCRRLEFAGKMDVDTFACELGGSASGVEVAPELREAVPDPLGEKLAALGNLRGQASIQFQLAHNPSATPRLRFDVKAELARGRIDDPRLPQPLTEMHANVQCNNAGYAINNLTAQIGQAALQMSCRREGFEPTSPMTLVAKVQRLELNRALVKGLPASVQENWDHYSPGGQIDANVTLTFDGKTWRPQGTVNCLNVSCAHYKFPYRLENAKGDITLRDDPRTHGTLAIKLAARGGGKPVNVVANLDEMFSDHPIGWVTIEAAEIPIDEALITAIPDKPREVVRALDPHGVIGFTMQIGRNRSDELVSQHLVINVRQGSVRYEKFPYPLSNIRGTIEMIDSDRPPLAAIPTQPGVDASDTCTSIWTFQNLEATHDTARVTCNGRFGADAKGIELVLNFAARDVPLDEALRDALKRDIQRVWVDLRPRGIVDLDAEVRYRPKQQQFNVDVRATPQRETASLEPVKFPYRLERLQGVLTYRNGHVAFERFKAEHGTVKIAADGFCDFQPEGRWIAHFDNVSVDRIRVTDRDLNAAMPDRLKKAVAELNPTGAINLRGGFELEQGPEPGDPLQSRWNVIIGLQQSNLQCGGVLLENVCGNVALRGGFNGQQTRSRGELNFDSLTVKDCQLTRVMGPFWIDNERMLFGEWVDSRENAANFTNATGPIQRPRMLTASLFGGTLIGQGWATFEATPRYATYLNLTNAGLQQCAKELGVRQKLQGKVNASVNLTGRGRSRNSLGGFGDIKLSECNLYELPVMVSLLKLLSIRPPDQNAFSDVAAHYRVEGEHIYFDRIDFRGDAISLRGSGHINSQMKLDMKFYTLVGRNELNVPVITDVFRGASQQLMQISVTGTVQNPETRKEALPVVNQALQQLRDELQNLR